MEQRLGILGGMGPQATQVFYQRVLDKTDAKTDQEHINTLIFSDTAIPDRTAAILSGHTEEAFSHLLSSAKLLESAGCTLLAMPCNTAHFFADALQEELSIPLLHMPRLAVEKLSKLGRKKVAVFATEGTVKTEIYQKELAAKGIASWVPDESLQQIATDIIYNEIKRGEKGSREKFAKLDKAARQAGCDGAVIGCTELSVFHTNYGLPEFYTDAMDLLAEACVLACGKPLREV